MSEASAPASSANLGPGFDTLALAIGLRCRVRAVPSETWTIRHEGPHVPSGRDIVEAAARDVAGSPLSLIVCNDIPIGRGLGSSAAAAAAGVAAAMMATGRKADPDAVFGVVSRLEGHPDNAAATVFGGLVSVTPDHRVATLHLDPRIVVVLAIPDSTLPTHEARRILPQTVDRDVAVRSLQRLTALVEGLRTADGELLAAAAGDEMHEGPRAHLSPLSGDIVTAARESGALHACWSGAGPSVLAFATTETRDSVAAAMGEELAGRGSVLTPELAERGLVVGDFSACD